MKHKGYAILIVLIAVAIMLILYVVQMKPLLSPGPPRPPAGIEQHPWMLAEMLVPENKDVKLPRPPKPELNEQRTINAAVTRNAEPRGTAVIHVGTDGRIRAAWNCDYAYDGQTHSITTEMGGNVNVKQTYEDENGTDKSRLFFIAKGHYIKKTGTGAWGAIEEKGAAWMLGWLKPDGTVEGHITITTTQEWVAAYGFTGPIDN